MIEKRPVFRSLTDPALLFYVPFSYVLVLLMAAAMLMIYIRLYVITALIVVALWVFGAVMTKRDPKWLEILNLRLRRNQLNFSKEGKRYLA